MSRDSPYSISKRVRPIAAECSFNLVETLQGIVTVRTRIPDNALTATVLGTERDGHGVVIDDQGLILTIGYLVTEAEEVWLVDHTGRATQGHVVAYDQQSGFGLVQALARLKLPSLELGSSSSIQSGQSMVLAAAGGISQSLKVVVEEVREFAGYWEYLLEKAIFTAPAHPFWGGAGLIGEDGKLYGIGSLIIQTTSSRRETADVNMVVPIDLLPPILEELMLYGRRSQPARPWIGWYVQATPEGLVVAGVADHGPADLAGITAGDVIRDIDGVAIIDLPMLYRTVWAAGPAGVDISVRLERQFTSQTLILTSVDRQSRLATANIH